VLHRTNPHRRRLALVIACAAVAFGVVPAEAQAFDVTISDPSAGATTASEVPADGTPSPGTTTFTASSTGGNINVTELDNALSAGNVIIDPGDSTGSTQVLTPVAGTGSGALTFGTATNVNGIALGSDISSGGVQTYTAR
jgi:hypothetical protein